MAPADLVAKPTLLHLGHNRSEEPLVARKLAFGISRGGITCARAGEKPPEVAAGGVVVVKRGTAAPGARSVGCTICYLGNAKVERTTNHEAGQPAEGPPPRMSDNADNSRSICPSVPTVIRR
jgi:hypothetical protein